ncbi:hypothetical protein DID77_03335 [Candidatus Marinamargulisbacteria bacterium SCGC AG-439-L15]|nr:hypothetical protein DID77_03335 [Candidatus Marinamargulisbacteria bacterium SCGC AG-439-L15]
MMTIQAHNNTPSSPSTSTDASHSQPQKKTSPGNELGNDTISLSKDFAKGTSTGSAGAASESKKAHQHEGSANTESAKKVTAAKSVAASQADTGINTQTKQQSKGLQSATTKAACPHCKGAGCPACRPDLSEVLTQEEKIRQRQLEELAIERLRKNRKTHDDATQKVTPIKRIPIDKTIIDKKPPGSVSTFADKKAIDKKA